MSPAFLQRLSWVSAHMPRTKRAIEQLPALDGVRLACSMHLEIKMVPAIQGFLSRGAQVFLATCNPATVCNDTVAFCKNQGAQAFAHRGMSPAELAQSLEDVLDRQPTHLCEMGADLSLALARRGGPKHAVRAGLEATGSGTTRLSALAGKFSYPIFNWDDLPIKEGLHNRHMVGLTACCTFFAHAQLTFHAKYVVVVGFGLVGQGVADAARAFGGAVTVVECDPVRALLARFAGWPVATLDDALPSADVVITATGATDILSSAQFDKLKDGVFLMNVGHANREIDVPALLAHPNEPLLPHIRKVALPQGRTVYLFAEGEMANLAAGPGDSLNAFDVTAAALVAAVGFAVTHGPAFPPGLHDLPKTAWQNVAQPDRHV